MTNIKIIVGRYHHSIKLTASLVGFPDFRIVRVNSAWKFGYIAEGKIDIYPRFGLTSEWDTASGQILLTEAGGLVVDLKGKPLQYNASESLINPKFLAIGDPSKLEDLLNMLNHVPNE